MCVHGWRPRRLRVDDECTSELDRRYTELGGGPCSSMHTCSCTVFPRQLSFCSVYYTRFNIVIEKYSLDRMARRLEGISVLSYVK